jgi:hypothetical protein
MTIEYSDDYGMPIESAFDFVIMIQGLGVEHG